MKLGPENQREDFHCPGCGLVLVQKSPDATISAGIHFLCPGCRTYSRFPHTPKEMPLTVIFDGNRGPHGFPAVGQCIYCGRKTHLSREHIIPKRLGGNVTLLASSCDVCATTTGRNEQTLLRFIYGDARAHLGLGDPKNRPQTVPVIVDGSLVDVPLELAPMSFVLMDMGEMPFFQGEQIADWKPYTPNVKFWRYDDPRNRFRSRALGHTVETSIMFAPDHLTLLLAKIAHAYATATIGFGGFEPFLAKMIHEGDHTVGHFIGCHPQVTWAEHALHTLDLEHRNELVVVHIRLFAFLGAPTYYVAVGKTP